MLYPQMRQNLLNWELAMVTAKDVARLAGVSQATVSYVMNGSRPISEATKRRVRRAMEELGYVPNVSARSLAGGRTGIIGVMVRLNNAQMAELRPFLVTIMHEVRQRGCNVMLLPAEEGVDGLRSIVRQGILDGVLIFDIAWHDDRLPEVKQLGIPTVLIGSTEDSHGLPCVDVDYRRIAQLAMNHLAQRGAQRVVVIGDPAHEMYGHAFSKFFADESRIVAQVLGMEFQLYVPSDDGWHGIWAAADLIRGLAACHGGLAVRTPQVLDQVLQLCAELGVQPGRDFSLVAVYVDGYAAELRTPVTNVDPVPDELSREGIQMLFDWLDGKPTSESRLVQPHITVRDEQYE